MLPSTAPRISMSCQGQNADKEEYKFHNCLRATIYGQCMGDAIGLFSEFTDYTSLIKGVKYFKRESEI